MKEIGNIFKEKREEIGITIEEVAKDLGIDAILIENLEDGNDKVFKNILEVKTIINTYSKYLDIENLNLAEEYNDYLFEKTSKINPADIKERLSKIQIKEEKAIKSPYTIVEKEQSKEKKLIVLLFIFIVILVVLYFILKRLIIG